MTTPSTTPSGDRTPKRLTRSREDRRLAGVCGGLSRYTGLDAQVVRLLTVVAVLVSGGTALIAYAAAWVLMPEAD